MLTIEEQRTIVQANRASAFNRLLGIIYTHKREIEALADARLEMGYPLYQDEMFHDPPDIRLKKVLEELADADNYLSSVPS